MKNLVELKNRKKGKLIFVGDTHGDLEATKIVVEKYLDNNKDNVIVFLGDYVDRGDFSRENIDFLLETRKKYPKQIILLLGNHDAYNQIRCYPCDFWDSLIDEEKEKYAQEFEKFPLVFSYKNIIAVHGALPDIKNLNEIEKIKTGDNNWMSLVWGDFYEQNSEKLNDNGTGRPSFGKLYFDRVMKNLGKTCLIRAHQPTAPLKMFDDRCLTIFTSNAYSKIRKRIVAVLDFADDELKIEGI